MFFNHHPRCIFVMYLLNICHCVMAAASTPLHHPCCSTPNTPQPRCCVASIHANICFGAADNPQPDDLIQSAIYSREWESDHHNGRGRPGHALPEGQGHQGMDIDSAAAHRIPRGRLGTSHRPTRPPSTQTPTACNRTRQEKEEKKDADFKASPAKHCAKSSNQSYLPLQVMTALLSQMPAQCLTTMSRLTPWTVSQ